MATPHRERRPPRRAVAGRRTSAQRRVNRRRVDGDRRESRRRNRGERIGTGAGVTLLVYALGTLVQMSHTGALAIAAGAVALILTPYVPWRGFAGRAYGKIGHEIQKLLERGKRRAAAEVCREAAWQLGELLDGSDSAVQDARIWTQFRADRRLTGVYHRYVEQVVTDALNRTQETISVPPWVWHCAEHPRNASDLRRLQVWLQRIADEYQV